MRQPELPGAGHASAFDPLAERSAGGDFLITIGDLRCFAVLERERAPVSCDVFESLLPLDGEILQGRWSGESGWLPLGRRIVVPPENATSTPQPGQLLLYAGPLSEPELLVPYGVTRFACRAGPLAGNHVASLVPLAGFLEQLERRLIRDGAQRVRIQRL